MNPTTLTIEPRNEYGNLRLYITGDNREAWMRLLDRKTLNMGHLSLLKALNVKVERATLEVDL